MRRKGRFTPAFQAVSTTFFRRLFQFASGSCLPSAAGLSKSFQPFRQQLFSKSSTFFQRPEQVSLLAAGSAIYFSRARLSISFFSPASFFNSAPVISSRKPRRGREWLTTFDRPLRQQLFFKSVTFALHRADPSLVFAASRFGGHAAWLFNSLSESRVSMVGLSVLSLFENRLSGRAARPNKRSVRQEGLSKETFSASQPVFSKPGIKSTRNAPEKFAPTPFIPRSSRAIARKTEP